MGGAASLPAPQELPLAERQAVLGGQPSLKAMCRRLREAKRVMLVSGAGISVSAGACRVLAGLLGR